MRQLAAGCALALALMGCATVPSLDAAPEDVADRIAGDAVAYNEAYGRAIADQVLLNVLRARDRLPLYHLSMSGIAEGSQVVSTTNLGLGTVGLGTGGRSPWAIGSASQQWADTTKPGYTLNPFSSGSEMRARQFEPIPAAVFQHYWENGWPIELLLAVTVERFDVTRPRTDARGRRQAPETWTVSNGSGGYRGDCGDGAVARGRPPSREEAYSEIDRQIADAAGRERARREWDARTAREARCDFVGTMRAITDAPGSRPNLDRIGCEPPQPPAPQTTPRTCRVQFRFGDADYLVQLRALDDMMYFIGSLLREVDDGVTRETPFPPMTARVNIRPTDVFPADGESWEGIARSAPLFRIVEVSRRGDAPFAAEVSYRGTRYAAGPPNGRACVGVERCGGREGPHNDASARVLSLLTQLVILSQSAEAQLAPRTIVVDGD